MEIPTKQKHYCHRCGTELERRITEKVPWYMKMIGGNDFNKKTGKKNVVEHYYCPNDKEPWYSFKTHSSFATMDRV